MIRRMLAAVSLALTAMPAVAQYQSESANFLQAVRDAKGDDVLNFLSKPGTTVVNAIDRTTGEGALHIVVKRGDDTYMRFLLQKGADPNIRDARGNTPLLLAVNGGFGELVDHLIVFKANVNQGNASGETPLIRAVQKRDLAMVRQLLAAGANPDQADSVAGMSARDYATSDARSAAIAKIINETPKSTRSKAAVAGPQL